MSIVSELFVSDESTSSWQFHWWWDDCKWAPQHCKNKQGISEAFCITIFHSLCSQNCLKQPCMYRKIIASVKAVQYIKPKRIQLPVKEKIKPIIIFSIDRKQKYIFTKLNGCNSVLPLNHRQNCFINLKK